MRSDSRLISRRALSNCCGVSDVLVLDAHDDHAVGHLRSQHAVSRWDPRRTFCPVTSLQRLSRFRPLQSGGKQGVRIKIGLLVACAFPATHRSVAQHLVPGRARWLRCDQRLRGGIRRTALTSLYARNMLCLLAVPGPTHSGWAKLKRESSAFLQREEIRNCPAAVIGNERHESTAGPWGLWEVCPVGPAGRQASQCPRVRRPAAAAFGLRTREARSLSGSRGRSRRHVLRFGPVRPGSGAWLRETFR